jgi:hypothetical protein
MLRLIALTSALVVYSLAATAHDYPVCPTVDQVNQLMTDLLQEAQSGLMSDGIPDPVRRKVVADIEVKDGCWQKVAPPLSITGYNSQGALLIQNASGQGGWISAQLYGALTRKYGDPTKVSP